MSQSTRAVGSGFYHVPTLFYQTDLSNDNNIMNENLIVTLLMVNVSLDQFRREEQLFVPRGLKNSAFIDMFGSCIVNIEEAKLDVTVTFDIEIVTFGIQDNLNITRSGPLTVKMPQILRNDFYKYLIIFC